MVKRKAKGGYLSYTYVEQELRDYLECKRAVKYIAIKDQSVSRSLENIGKHIVQHFFKGDLRRVKSQNPMKGFSLNRLAEQEGMVMSRTSLRRCVDLFAQRKEIGTWPAMAKFSTTHRIALLQVEDIEQKKADIQLIIDGKLSVRQYLELLKNRYAQPALTDGATEKKPTPYSDANKAVHGLTAAKINVETAPRRNRSPSKPLRRNRSRVSLSCQFFFSKDPS